MSDFIVALGLFFAFEGLVLAAFPASTKRMMATVLDTPDGLVHSRLKRNTEAT